ncbi:hypothetical protein FTV88_0806 [Heliorestis convoluta]|uniref:Uncharacterized protein n=1 Tax=Heliorestis convoluta TaxID=356322 RepID=A0A5Q2MZQ4_9FIRM|nr:hypothetical protein FTV88_0806 [Heliorestis convoluta]
MFGMGTGVSPPPSSPDLLLFCFVSFVFEPTKNRKGFCP